MSTRAEVAVVMGSESDWPLVEEAVKTLDQFGVASEVKVLSAHRTPALASAFARGAQARGIKVIIAAAGGAAHLAGVLAAQTVLPVVGLPVKGGALNGVDALLATVQMPAGVPVATVTLGSAGPTNAAILAVQILALGRGDLRRKLAAHKKALEKKVLNADAKLRAARGKKA